MNEETQKTNTPVVSAKKFPIQLKKLNLNFRVLGIIFGALLLGLGIFAVKGFVVAALVNGRPITRLSVVAELERRTGQQVLDGLINQSLIDQEAKKQKITVTQAELDTDLKQIEDNMKAQGTNLDQALVTQNLDRKQFYVILRTNKLLEKLIADKVTVSDDEVTQYMTANKDSMPKDTPADTLKGQIKTYLQQQKVDSESQKLFADLRAKAHIIEWAKF